MTAPGPTVAGPTVALRCRLGWVETVEWVGLYGAEANGGFAAESLAVELVPGGPGAPSAAVDVAEGTVEIGIPSDFLAVVDLVEHGAPLRVVGAVMGSSPLGVAWPAGRGPVTLEALCGARIGAGADADRHVLEALFDAAGLEPEFTFHLIGAGTDELEAGAVDAMCCSTVSQPAAAALRGLALTTATFAELGLPMPADAVVVRDDLLRDRPEVVARFLRALAAGWRWAIDHPGPAVDLAVRRPGAPAGTTTASAAAEHDEQIPFVTWAPRRGLPLLGIDRPELDRSLRLLAEARGTTASRAADLVDAGPLSAALGSGDGRRPGPDRPPVGAS